jgi:hypothetical protein
VFWNARAHQLMRLRLAWAQVTHPSHPDQPLFLVVVRGWREPWYLLTNEAISSEEDAWQVALAYLQRGPLEQVWRVDKSEFGEDQRAHLGLGGPAQAALHGHAGSCLPLALDGQRPAA